MFTPAKDFLISSSAMDFGIANAKNREALEQATYIKRSPSL